MPRRQRPTCCCEIAETSLRYDRTVKLALYAEAGVPEYWVVDAGADAIEVYRGPAPDGYREVTLAIGEGTVAIAFVAPCPVPAPRTFPTRA